MRLPILIKADIRTTKQSHIVHLGEGQWGFLVEGNLESKVAICWESPNGIKNQFDVMHDPVYPIDGPTNVFAVIEEAIGKSPISVYAVRQ